MGQFWCLIVCSIIQYKDNPNLLYCNMSNVACCTYGSVCKFHVMSVHMFFSLYQDFICVFFHRYVCVQGQNVQPRTEVGRWMRLHLPVYGCCSWNVHMQPTVRYLLFAIHFRIQFGVERSKNSRLNQNFYDKRFVVEVNEASQYCCFVLLNTNPVFLIYFTHLASHLTCVWIILIRCFQPFLTFYWFNKYNVFICMWFTTIKRLDKLSVSWTGL